MIIIEKLSFAYDEKPVINGISMMLEEGIHGIIGINGSGKTTLLNLIYGLLKPDSGSILYNGSPKMKKKYIVRRNGKLFLFAHYRERTFKSI